jgi:tetratricopeptide (TPR) repeat protein
MRRFLYFLQAMLGNLDEARRLRQLALADAEELGLTTRIATIGESYYPSFALGSAEIEQFLRRSLAIYTEHGWEAMRSSVAPRLALALSDQGRYEEAEALAPTGDHPVRPDDYDARFFDLAARARVLAWRGDVDTAESLVREAMAIADRTDNLQARAWIRIELSELLSRTGKSDEAHSLLEAAIQLAEEKESVAIAERARARLAELRSPAAPH